MQSKALYIYRLVNGKEAKFPASGEQARLAQYTYTAQRMGGAPQITGTLNYSRSLDDDWTGTEYVKFEGKNYYLLTKPGGKKTNDSIPYAHSVSFVDERVLLEREFFYDVVSADPYTQYNDRFRSNFSKFTFMGDIREFVSRFNDALSYVGLYDYDTKTGFNVVIDDSLTEEQLSKVVEVSFDSEYLATVLQRINSDFKLAYYWVGRTCHVGYTENVIDTAFEYGSEGGLLTVNKENSNNAIVDRVTGVGGEDNIPYYYPNDNAEGEAIYEVENAGNASVASIDLSVLWNTLSFAPMGHDFILYKQLNKPQSSTDLGAASTGTTTEEFELSGKETPQNPGIQIPISKTYEFDNIYIKKGYSISTSKLDLSKISAVQTNYVGKRSNGKLYDSGDYRSHFEEKALDINELHCAVEVFDEDGNSICEVGSEGEYKFFESRFVTIKVTVSFNVTANAAVLVTTGPMGGNPYVIFKEYKPSIRYNTNVLGSFTISHNEMSFSDSGYIFKTTNRDGEAVYVPIEKSGINVNNLSSAVAVSVRSAYTKDKGFTDTLVFAESQAFTVKITDRRYITPSQYLMPSVYRNTYGADRYINAENNKYTDADGNKFVFTNVYSKENPHAGKQDFSDVIPTIRNIKNEDGELIGEIADIAFDANDSDETKDKSSSTKEYVHSYFYIKLHKFNGKYGFNLFDQALETDTAKVSMVSGPCASCKFEIGVIKQRARDGKSYIFKNPVQVKGDGKIEDGDYFGSFKDSEIEDGDFGSKVRVGKYQEQQQDTSTNEVWIAVKKEIDTFGVVMPNATNKYYPKVGDKFVLTGIKMPKVYILEAEERLDKALLKYMQDNNVEKYNFSITFSRIWLEEHKSIVAKLNENARIHVKYNGKDVLLYVTNYSIKADGNILSEITVQLAEEVNVAESTLALTLKEAKSDILDSISNSDALAQGAKFFLRKDMEDITEFPINASKLRAKEGLVVGSYSDELPEGTGAKIDERGNAEMESLKIRSYLEVLELVVNRLTALEGDQMFTESDTIDSVTKNNDGTLTLKLREKWEGYYTAQAKNNVIKGIYNDVSKGRGSYLTSWAKVNSVDTSNNTINVSLYNDADTPAGKNFEPREGMNIVRWGNTVDTTRQSCFYISSSDGRIVRLTGVTKPIINQSNYATTLGTLPDSLAQYFKGQNAPLIDGLDYFYARGILVQDLIQVDYQGMPIATVVDRGVYDKSNTYYCNEANAETGVFEISDVWFNNARYRCAISKTTEEPSENSTAWTLIEKGAVTNYNLLLKSAVSHSSSPSSYRYLVGSYTLTEDWIDGQEYTLYIDATYDGDVANIAPHTHGYHNLQIMKLPTLVSGNNYAYQATFTFHSSNDATYNATRLLAIYVKNTANGVHPTVTINKIKLEKGSIATPWNRAESEYIGAKGDTGEQGKQGETGKQGKQGETGKQGEKGDKGDKGDTGASVNYNLILNSSVPQRQDASTANYMFAEYTLTEDWIDGQTYALSVWMRIEGKEWNWIQAFVHGSHGLSAKFGMNDSHIVNTHDDYYELKVLLKYVKQSNDTGNMRSLRFYSDEIEQGDYPTIIFEKIKLEKGTEFTPWNKAESEYRGPALRVQKWDSVSVGIPFYCGTDGETYLDVVEFNGNYYECKTSHTKTASSPTPLADYQQGGKTWKLGTKLEMVATRLMLAEYSKIDNLWVDSIEMYDKDDPTKVVFKAKDGDVVAKTGSFDNVVVENSTLKDVSVSGSLRQPFTLPKRGFDSNFSDNVHLSGTQDFWDNTNTYELLWDSTQNGRKLFLANYKCAEGISNSQGQVRLNAPSDDKYFYENGVAKSYLSFSREAIEMIGYGDGDTFYGWIVLNRTPLINDYMPRACGRPLKVYATGNVIDDSTSSTPYITANCVDGSWLLVDLVTSKGLGYYRIYIPRKGVSSAPCTQVWGEGVYNGNANRPVTATIVYRGQAVKDDITYDVVDVRVWYYSGPCRGSFGFVMYSDNLNL